MAAPNLQSPTTINGKTAFLALSSTSETALLTNAASSGQAMHVKAVTVGNSSTSLACDITLKVYSAASGGTAYQIGPITVPAYGSLIVIGSENAIWLEEDRRITLTASASNQLTAIAAYEVVS